MFTSTAYAQDGESPCKSDPVYSKQDFKLGVWDVQLANGKSVGTQTFEKMLDDCVIKETWAGTNGRKGTSFTYYNAATGYWHQTFVDNQGSSTVGYGKWDTDGKMTFTGRSSKGYYIRWTTYKVSENEMKGQNERSDDMGETWKPLGEIKYVRK
jgi:hypothetical protein